MNLLSVSCIKYISKALSLDSIESLELFEVNSSVRVLYYPEDGYFAEMGNWKSSLTVPLAFGLCEMTLLGWTDER